MHFDQDYTAERLSEVDPNGPQTVGIDYSDATEEERAMYRRWAYQASEHMYRYAVHTVVEPDTLTAIFAVNRPMDIRREGDRYDVWGEPMDPEGEHPEHLVVATSDPVTVRAVVSALDSLGQPSDVTALWDWADDEEGFPGHTEQDLGIIPPKERATWGKWMIANDH